MAGQIAPKSGSLYYHGGPHGILLIHGFTGNPSVFRDLISDLKKLDFTISAPLLAGHGGVPQDLEQATWRDWYRSVEESYSALAKECDDVIVVGFSLGAALSAYLVAHKPAKALVLIGIPRWLMRQLFVKYMSPVYLALGIRYYDETNNYFLKMLQEDNLNSHIFPIRSVRQMLAFVGKEVVRYFRRIKIPTLIVQSGKDGVVSPVSALSAYRQIRSPQKRLVWVGSQHTDMPLDPEVRRVVCDFVINFK